MKANEVVGVAEAIRVILEQPLSPQLVFRLNRIQKLLAPDIESLREAERTLFEEYSVTPGKSGAAPAGKNGKPSDDPTDSPYIPKGKPQHEFFQRRAELFEEECSVAFTPIAYPELEQALAGPDSPVPGKTWLQLIPILSDLPEESGG